MENIINQDFMKDVFAVSIVWGDIIGAGSFWIEFGRMGKPRTMYELDGPNHYKDESMRKDGDDIDAYISTLNERVLIVHLTPHVPDSDFMRLVLFPDRFEFPKDITDNEIITELGEDSLAMEVITAAGPSQAVLPVNYDQLDFLKKTVSSMKAGAKEFVDMVPGRPNSRWIHETMNPFTCVIYDVIRAGGDRLSILPARSDREFTEPITSIDQNTIVIGGSKIPWSVFREQFISLNTMISWRPDVFKKIWDITCETEGAPKTMSEAIADLKISISKQPVDMMRYFANTDNPYAYNVSGDDYYPFGVWASFFEDKSN